MAKSLNQPEPPPKAITGPKIWDLVIEDISYMHDSGVNQLMIAEARERDAQGEKKYGVALRAFDGRDSMIDAYQEVMDLVVYLKKAVIEATHRKAPKEVTRVFEDHYINALLQWGKMRKTIYARTNG